jgi:hypothetical protein
LTKAVERKQVDSIYELGLWFQAGLFVEQDDDKAMRCFEEASQLGLDKATSMLQRRKQISWSYLFRASIIVTVTLLSIVSFRLKA